MKEIWKDIRGYEGLYKISNLGKVVSIPRMMMRKNGKAMRINGSQKRFGIGSNGYYRVGLYDGNGNKKMVSVHRLLAIAFIPNPDNKPCINHKDSNRLNLSLENLEWVTYQENTDHSIKQGLFGMLGQTGDLHNNSKAVIAIDIKTRTERRFGSQREAARVLNLNQSNIGRVVKGKVSQTGGFTFKLTK